MNVGYHIDDPGSSLVFVRNAPVLTIYNVGTAGGVSISAVEILKGGTVLFSLPEPFQADADGKVQIDVREIAEGLPFGKIPCEQYARLYDPELILRVKYYKNGEQQSMSFKIPWVQGGFDPTVSGLDNLLKKRYWLTWRPDSVKTYAWGKEYLYFYIGNETEWNEEMKVLIEVFGKNGESWLIERIISPHSEHASIVCQDVSYGQIQGSSDLRGLTDKEITAWEVRISAPMDGADHPVMRFTLEDSRPGMLGFVFRNNLGVFDTVYSRGKSTDRLEHETQLFRSHYTDGETANWSHRFTETFSGLLTGEEERNLWMEFLESDERYVLTQDRKLQKIVLESASCEMARLATEGLSFTWRLARLRQGGGFFRDGKFNESSGGMSSSSF